MNYFKFKKIIYKARKIALTKDERKSMRADFMSKIGFEEENNLSKPFIITDLKKPKVLTLVISCCFMIVALPVVYASEKSLPGDVFYPIKTKINEPIKKVVNNIVSDSSEEYEIELLEKKFEEAKELIENERLDEKRSEKVRESINKQIEKSQSVIKELEKIEKENPQEISEKVSEKVDKELDKVEDKLEKEIKKEEKKDRVKEVLEKNTDVLDKIKLKI